MLPTLKPLLIAVALALSVGSAALAQADDRPRTLTVSGEGRVAALPDVAYVGLGIAETRRTAADALQAMSLSSGAVLDRLLAAGIPPEDIQTGQLSLNPVYDHSINNGPPKITGFQSLTTLNVTVRDLAIVGKVLDAAVQDGANRLDGIRFDISDPEPLLDDARRAAVAQARHKAELLSTAAGVSLGPLITLTEQSTSPQPIMAMEARMMDAGSAVPIAEGEVTLMAQITLIYALQD